MFLFFSLPSLHIVIHHCDPFRGLFHLYLSLLHTYLLLVFDQECIFLILSRDDQDQLHNPACLLQSNMAEAWSLPLKAISSTSVPGSQWVHVIIKQLVSHVHKPHLNVLQSDLPKELEPRAVSVGNQKAAVFKETMQFFTAKAESENLLKDPHLCFHKQTDQETALNSDFFVCVCVCMCIEFILKLSLIFKWIQLTTLAPICWQRLILI